MTATATILNPKVTKDDMSVGLASEYRLAMANDLSNILASTYQLTVKSHIYHWNAVGPIFKSFHELTEEHYEELFQAADVIAERIRALGHLAPVKTKFVSAFTDSEIERGDLRIKVMIDDLIECHEQCVCDLRQSACKAGDADDFVTEDMLTERMTFHEKALWMLRAISAE